VLQLLEQVDPMYFVVMLNIVIGRILSIKLPNVPPLEFL
jgi:hypothetical protein